MTRAFVVIPLAALLATATPAQADLAEVKAAGALRVIVAADEAPETFATQAGDRPGFEREMLESFARLHGLRLEVVTAKAYADRIPMLVGGKGDVIAAIFDTPERRKQVAFTTEVMPTHNVAVNVAPQPPIATLDDLRAARVAVIRGAKPAEEAAAAGVKTLLPYPRLDDLLQALKANEATAAVLPVSELAIASKRFPGLQAGVTVGERGTVSWAVRQEDGELRAALDAHLGNLRKTSWSRLVVKYFGDQALNVLGRTR
jgi:polar amino acid transport system substrate-binding protein